MGHQQTSRGLKKPPAGLELLRQHAARHREVSGEYDEIDGEVFNRISNSHLMQPFFMSLATGSDHWTFIASNGALTAGRQNSDSALFPYYSADKIVDMAEFTGPKTIIQLQAENGIVNWEPFSLRNTDLDLTRNIYKNEAGSKIIFEEINHTLEMIFRYSWTTGERFGFIRQCHLANFRNAEGNFRILDGLQNIVPSGMDSDFQLRFSNLGDAYKKNELIPNSDMGIYYLSSIPSDRAEPNEGLQGSTVWQYGLPNPTILLCADQVEKFRTGKTVETEQEIRGRRGCFLACDTVLLSPNDSASWMIVADVNLDQTDVIRLRNEISTNKELRDSVILDINNNNAALTQTISSSDGIQAGESRLRTNRHRSNTTFNVMRGGLPINGYLICAADFRNHVATHNKSAAVRHEAFLKELDQDIDSATLAEMARSTNDPDLLRITNEYLPFAFSRRHGDPTRPWNQFSIDIRNEDGSRKLNYEGNWRDLFQNWEALGCSFPNFLPGMLLRFVNASTADGYNPYRISKAGFDWEKPDASDPWSNIGYWGDHQIIYLLRLIEQARRFAPKSLDDHLATPNCVFANVPYRIHEYQRILEHPRDTILYDRELAEKIARCVDETGADGQLLRNNEGIVRVSFFEKLVITGLTKMSNLVPDAGIWLNTQRPEWNDANNALVGNGTSVVTACYLRRFFAYMSDWISEQETEFSVSIEVVGLFDAIRETIENIPIKVPLSASQRRETVDKLQIANESYRRRLYKDGLTGRKRNVSSLEFSEFAKLCVSVLDQTIRSNLRNDCLYHAYNLINFQEDGIEIQPLCEMLEGQVAVLSSGMLSSAETVLVLDALRLSKLYRSNQNSYLLYPDKQLPRFLEKNEIDQSHFLSSPLLQHLVETNEQSIVRVDVNGGIHFNGNLRNAADVADALTALEKRNKTLREMIRDESVSIGRLFESTFDHDQFTGRSGTFFAYEGLGSIYWHMVSKLALVVQENYLIAQSEGALRSATKLKAHYREIRNGLGLTKTPTDYGAFPTDPYSHTPNHAGVQQPGMTGQVKEDILARLTEIGVRVVQGSVHFDASLFEDFEFLRTPCVFEFINRAGDLESIPLEASQFGFTFCQVPIIYRRSKTNSLSIHRSDGTVSKTQDLRLSEHDSRLLFDRDQSITRIDVYLPDSTADFLTPRPRKQRRDK